MDMRRITPLVEPHADIVGELVVQAWDEEMFMLNASMFSDFANNIIHRWLAQKMTQE